MALAHQTAYFYADDDVTPLFSASTDPAHTSPWVGAAALKRSPDSGVASEPNIREGTSRIGTRDIEVTDNYTNPLDQRTGWFTAEMYDALGHSRLISRRVRLLEKDPLAGPDLVRFDGTIQNIALKPNRTTYVISLRDIRERERRMSAFVTNEYRSIFPPGIVDGYGKNLFDGSFLAALGNIFPDPKREPYLGTYNVDPATAWAGRVTLANPFGITLSPEQWDSNLSFGYPTADFDPATGQTVRRYRDAVLWWRDEGSSDPWKVLRHMRVPPASALSGYANVFLIEGRDDRARQYRTPKYIVLSEPRDLLAGWEPANTQAIELFISSGKPPSPELPLYREWETHGHMLEELWNGVHGDPAVGLTVRFDQPSVDSLKFSFGAGPARIKRTEPIADVREYVGPNILKPLGRAPIIDDDGKVKLIRTALPDASTALVALNDDNCTFTGATWKHGASSVITKSEFHYKVDVVPGGGLVGPVVAPVDALTVAYEREVHEEKVNIAGAAIHGIKPITYRPDSFRGTYREGGGIFGNTVPLDEFKDFYASWRALERNIETVDRYYEGTPDYELRASLDDPAVLAAREGSWCSVAIDSFPDTLSNLRGSNRLAQIVGLIRDSARVVRFRLSDVGPLLAPLGAPAFAAPVADAATSRVSVATTVIPAGAEIFLEYGVGAVVPAPSSSDWHPFARSPAHGTFATPPLIEGGTVWIRAQSRAVGRISSAVGAGVSVVLAARLTFASAEVRLDALGAPAVSWIPPAATLGVRVAYYEHDVEVAPPAVGTWPFVDVEAVLLGTTLPLTIRQGRQVSVQLTAYAGWTPPNVSGAAGDIFRVSAARDDRGNPVMPVVKEQPQESTTVGTLLLSVVDPQARIRHVYFATATGNNPLGAYVEDSTIPYSFDVALVDKQPSRIGYRIEGIRGDGTEGILAENVVPFSSQQQPSATVTVSATNATVAAVIDDIVYGAATSFIDVFQKDYAADPGSVGSVEFIGTRPANMPLRKGDGRTVISHPSGGASRWVVRTYIPYDSLNNRGSHLTIKTQAAASAPPTLPPDLADLDLVVASETLEGADLDVTMPGDVTNIATIRIYHTSGSLIASFTRTAGASGVQTVTLTGLDAGTHYSVNAKGRSAGGLESTNPTAAVDFDTTSGGALADPTGLNFENLGESGLATWSPGAGYPEGVVYEVYSVMLDGGDPPPDLGETTLYDTTSGESMIVEFPGGADIGDKLWVFVIATPGGNPGYFNSGAVGPVDITYGGEL